MCVTCTTSYQLSSHSQAPFLLSNKSPDFKLAERPHSPALCTAEGGWLPGYVPTSKISEVETNCSAQSQSLFKGMAGVLLYVLLSGI